MELRTATACLVLVGSIVAHEIAHGATVGDGLPRQASTERAGQEVLLRALDPREGELLWVGDPVAVARRTTFLRLLERERRLDPSVKLEVRSLEKAFEPAEQASLARADRSLTRAWFGYLSRRRGSSETVDPKIAARAVAVLERFDPSHDLSLAAVELAIVEAVGGWRPVSASLEPLPDAPTLEAVAVDGDPPPPKRRLVVEPAQLRRRLVQSMDLQARYLERDPPEAVLTQAVRRFQRRHGLSADGVVGWRTLAALREPATEQLARVQANLARAVDLASRAALRLFVEVNIPAFELRVVRDGAIVLRSRVIVGDDKTPTPILGDVIRFIELDPVWYVPTSIVNEVLQRGQKEPGYLERAGFVWRPAEGGRPRLIQRPGPENALGRFKFVFPNHHAVYLHDTAQRGLFGRADQALSHGCVRVERPAELALALLADQGWDAARLGQALATRRTRRIELAEPVPVFLDYRTVDLDAEGRLVLFEDVYGHDRTARASTESGKRTTSWPRSPRPAMVDQDSKAGRIASTPTETAFD
jgi:hypothetical protein